MKKLFLWVGMIIMMVACYEEVPVAASEQDVFEISVSPEMQETLFTSKDSAYVVEGPLFLSYNGQGLSFREIKVRGETSLDFRRKSFGVKLNRPIYLRGPVDGQVKKLTRFKLIALAMDYTYINNRLAFGILEEAGVMPLFYKYVNLWLNGENQGVYFLVEDPEKFYKEQASECIIRRDYNHNISDIDYDRGIYDISQEDYVMRYKEIYSMITRFQGRELHDLLAQSLDIDQYFRKMALDYFLKNGDATDEIYLYSRVSEGKIGFRIIPWDYDDIFSSLPHEVGRAWAVGKVFGVREYPDYQSVLNETGDRMIFSIEDDLDYTVATDSILYGEYEKVMREMFRTIDSDFIDRLFMQIEKELTPFYEVEEVVLQSQYDLHPSTYELWEENMQARRTFLLGRLEEINGVLNTIAQ